MRNLLFIAFSFFFHFLCGQNQDRVDFTETSISIQIDSASRKIMGNAVYEFKVLSKIDSVFFDAIDMQFSSVKIDGKKANFSNDKKKITLYKKLKPGERHKIELDYNVQPKQTVYFVGWEDGMRYNNQIWTQGQGKYTSHWVPSFDDMNEKLTFKLQITFDATYEVIANGKLQGSSEANGLKTWSYVMDKPMSSYLLAFAIGDYEKKSTSSTSGVPIALYYYKTDSLRVEPTYRYTKEIFDFLETEIGVSYPWQNYKQLPVRDFLYAGMENTGATIFSDGFVIDSLAFKDKNYVNVNAHELAHQWFGNLVTEKNGKHHWLHEGFATYYAYMAEKEIFGDSYFYWRLYDTAKQLEALEQDDRGDALTNPSAGSLTFYEKGAWALYMLEQKLGRTIFRKGIRNYLNKYQFLNVSIDDFMYEMEEVSGKDLSAYKALWIEGDNFPFEEAKNKLSERCESIRQFLELRRELTTSSADDESIIRRYWEGSTSDELRKRVIYNYYKSLSTEFVKVAFSTNSFKIRQALAVEVAPIPAELKSLYEGLIEDESYSYRRKCPLQSLDHLSGRSGGLLGKNPKYYWVTQ